MATALAILGWTIAVLVILVGLALDLVGLFGNWLILAALAGIWIATGFEHFGAIGIGAFIGFATLGEILEAVLAGYGAKRFGGSPGSMVAALVGTLVGAVVGSPWLPIIGTLVGACLGAFAAATLWEYLRYERTVYDSMWTGLGAAVGKIGGLVAKFVCGLSMLLAAFLTYGSGGS